jgi:hypothetical protein
MEPYLRVLTYGARAQRWKAVDDLQEMGTPQAADALLKLVEGAARRPTIDDQATLASRALTALSQMTDKTIPERLTKALEICSTNAFACRIGKALAEGYSMSSHSSSTPVLSLRHTAKDRTDAVAAWRKLSQDSSTTPWGGRSSPLRRSLSSRSRSYSSNDDTSAVALLALTAAHAEATAGRLETTSWSGNSPATKYQDKVVALPGAGETLAAALEGGANQLARLARSHPGSNKFVAELDGVAAGHKARNLACLSQLQMSAVALDTQGQYLAVMVGMSDGAGKSGDAMKDVARRRAEAMAGVKNVLEELRENSYFNLLLWDMLLQCQKDRQ